MRVDEYLQMEEEAAQRHAAKIIGLVLRGADIPNREITVLYKNGDCMECGNHVGYELVGKRAARGPERCPYCGLKIACVVNFIPIVFTDFDKERGSV